MDWLDLLAVQGSLKSLLQHHSSKASIFWRSAFFTVQLSHLYMTTGKTILERFYEDLQDLLELTPKKDVLLLYFIIGDWNAKVGSQETPGIKANFALEYRMKQGKG